MPATDEIPGLTPSESTDSNSIAAALSTLDLEGSEKQALSKLLGLSTKGPEDILDAGNISELLEGLNKSEVIAGNIESKLDAILSKLDGLIDSIEIPDGEINNETREVVQDKKGDH